MAKKLRRVFPVLVTVLMLLSLAFVPGASAREIEPTTSIHPTVVDPFAGLSPVVASMAASMVMGTVALPQLSQEQLAAAMADECFPQTGNCMSGPFAAYWHLYGLPIFGYPISTEFVQKLEDGNSYTVQYFERARLEKHGSDVMLGQFGRAIYGQQFVLKTGDYAVMHADMCGSSGPGRLINSLNELWDTTQGRIGGQSNTGNWAIPSGSFVWTDTVGLQVRLANGSPAGPGKLVPLCAQGSWAVYFAYDDLILPSPGRYAHADRPFNMALINTCGK